MATLHPDGCRAGEQDRAPMPDVINAKGWNKGNHRLWRAQVDQVSPSDGCKSGKQECSLSVQVIIRALTYGRQSRGNRWISAGASFSSRRGFRRLEAGSFQAAHKNHQRSANKEIEYRRARDVIPLARATQAIHANLQRRALGSPRVTVAGCSRR